MLQDSSQDSCAWCISLPADAEAYIFSKPTASHMESILPCTTPLDVSPGLGARLLASAFAGRVILTQETPLNGGPDMQYFQIRQQDGQIVNLNINDESLKVGLVRARWRRRCVGSQARRATSAARPSPLPPLASLCCQPASTSTSMRPEHLDSTPV